MIVIIIIIGRQGFANWTNSFYNSLKHNALTDTKLDINLKYFVNNTDRNITNRSFILQYNVKPLYSCNTNAITHKNNHHAKYLVTLCVCTYIRSDGSLRVFCFVAPQGQRKICSLMLPALPSVIDPSSQIIPCHCATQIKVKVLPWRTLRRTWLT